MVQAILKGIVSEGLSPSVSLLVWKRGKTDFVFSYPDKFIYDCASITKPLVTFPIVKQLLDFGEEVKDYFLSAPNSVKVEDLLNHTSGLIPWLPLYLYKDGYLNALLKFGFKGKKGEKVYSCLNYILLKFMLEKKTGISFREIVKSFLGKTPGCYVPPLKCINVAPTEKGNLYEYKLAKKFFPNPDRKKFRLNRVIKGETHDLNSHHSQGIAGNSGLFADVFGASILVENILKSENYSLPFFETEDYFYHLGFTGTGVAIHKKKDVFAVFLSNRVCPSVTNEDFSRVRHSLFKKIFEVF